MHIVSHRFYDFQPRPDHRLFLKSFYESLDKEHGYHDRELDSHHDMMEMFNGEINSCHSLPEVERCCNAFLNAISHVCSHDPTRGYGMAYHVLHYAKELKDKWEDLLGIKLTDVPTFTSHTLPPFDKK